MNNDASQFPISENEVRKEFEKLNASKSAGPDNLSGRILKSCTNQLCTFFAAIFNFSFQNHQLPSLWKTSCIIPVPKKSSVNCTNDLRPVALTPIPMKCFERILLRVLKDFTCKFLDPLQFAHRTKRSTEDALLYLTDKIYSHLDSKQNRASSSV